ncbi:MAG: DNA primase catalytic subunit PriS, partial [Candidatus Methanofastidiosia archaeon]
MEFKPATPEERRIYYTKEWKPKDVPEFIVKDIKEKEFAFDHIGKGYTDRYNSFRDLKGLEAKIKNICPYAV